VTTHPPLRIALFVPQLAVSGGLGVYCRSVLEGLLRAGPAETILVLAPAEPRKLFPHSGLEDGWQELVADPRVQLVPLAWPAGYALSQTMDRALAEPLAKLHADVLHCTYYTGMAKPPCRQLITFHDSGFLENPGTFGDTARQRRETFTAMAAQVHRLVFTSGDARDRVCRLLPFDPACTEIVNLSLADRPEALADARNPEWMQTPLWLGGETIGSWGSYLFVPVGAATGFNRIRKNVPTAVAAFRARPLPGMKLIIASTGLIHDKLLAELLPESERASGRMVGDAWRSADDALHVLPNLERAGFLAAMARARAVVYPTRFEGFGLPSVEAMALGVPLIAGNATAVPEVVGDAGLLIDPDDVAGFTEAYHRVLNDAALTAELIRRGKARVSRFSLDRLGEEMLAVYRRAVLSRPSPP
jgi:glycosyltransferase involved in cell wall biosynthesis